MKSSARVLVDFERLKYLNCGLGQYSLNLAKELGRQFPSNLESTFLVPQTFLNAFGPHQYFRVRGYLKKLRWTLPQVDLWHMTHQDSHYGPKNQQTPILLTVHDLNFLGEKSPAKAERRRRLLQNKIDRATAVTTVSNFSANEIRKNLSVQDKPIYVIHNGVDLSHLGQTVDSIRPTWAPEKPFFLALAVVTKKKNFHVLVEMMRHFPKFDLVIAGSHDPTYVAQIRQLMEQNGLEHQILLPGEVSGGVKTWLYQNCATFLFPSLLEGFGFPVLEAMSFGKPVVCSNRTSLPEIAGDQAFFWHDFNSQTMASVVQACLDEFQKNPAEKTQALVRHAQKFTWARAAQGYISVYQEILAQT